VARSTPGTAKMEQDFGYVARKMFGAQRFRYGKYVDSISLKNVSKNATIFKIE